MKKLFLISAILGLFFSISFAQDFVADPNEYNVTDVNPAGLEYFKNVSFAFSEEWTKELSFNSNNDRHFYFNLRSIGYSLHKGLDNNHTLALSTSPLNNFYVGSSFNWTNKDFKEGKFSESFLYRPFNMLSVGAKFSDIFDKSNHSADFGIALRPIYFSGKFWDRLNLDVQSSYKESKFLKPLIGIKTEFLNGIFLNGAYNLETKTAMFGFSISTGHLRVGNTISSNDNETSGRYFIKVTKKAERNPGEYIMKFKPTYYDFQLSGKLVNTKPEGMKLGFININMGKYITINEIKNKLKTLSKNKYLKGIIIKSPRIKVGIANLQELKDAFDEFRKSGKKVIFYFDNVDGADYTFAAILGDKIYVNNLADISLPHLGVKAPYLKELLDKLGIEVQNFRSHKYKTAGNMFSEEKMTEAEKETYEALLNDIYGEIKKLIVENRGEKLKKPFGVLVDMKPFFSAQEAMELGLIDGITYKKDLNEALKEYGKKPLIAKRLEIPKRTDWANKSKSKVAIIYAIGNIHMGKGMYGKSIGEASISDAIKAARKNPKIKGIILRVDSGGGSALASDIIAHEVELCKTENHKPVVVSMGRVAASGGYYISAYADKIIAQPTTITGSIGVIGMVPEFSKLYKKIGVNWSELNITKYAGFPPTNRPMTEDEKKFMGDMIHKIYWDFVNVVAKGRNKTKDEIHQIAQGRVWSGISAYRLGLVDKLGGLEDAKKEIKKLARIKNDIELVEFKGKSKNPLSQYGIGTNILYNKLPNELKSTYNLLNNFNLYKNDKVLMLTPISLEIK